MAAQLIETARPMFQRAVEKAEFGEEITWDISWGVIPHPMNGQPVGVYLVYVHLPALHAIGAFVQATFPVDIGFKEPVIERTVADNIENLRVRRTQLLQQSANGQSEQPPGGLVMP